MRRAGAAEMRRAGAAEMRRAGAAEQQVPGGGGPAWPPVARAFRRVALPLAWYYAVTLALPLANGAAHAGAAFMEHALIVLILPPVLIVLASVACEMARALAGLERRRLPAAQQFMATSPQRHRDTETQRSAVAGPPKAATG